MPWVKIFITVLFFSPIIFANEHEAPAGGEHGGAAAPAANFSGKQTQEWNEVQTKLSALKTKVEAQEALVKSLMVQKPGAHEAAPAGGGEHGAPAAPSGGGHGESASAAGNADPMASRIEQLKKEHQKLQTMIADYNKMNAEYETKFPEKGLKESRIYRRLDPQAIRMDETASSYEEGVQRLQNKIMRQYPKASQNIKLEKKSKKPIAKIKDAEEKKELPKTGDVTEQIILQK